jgi:hypothetical protein
LGKFFFCGLNGNRTSRTNEVRRRGREARSELVTPIPLRSTRQSVLLALRSALKFSYPQLATVPFVPNLSLSSSNANCENFVSPRAFRASHLLFSCITCILASSTYGISSSILSELKNRRKGKIYMKVQRGGDNINRK